MGSEDKAGPMSGLVSTARLSRPFTLVNKEYLFAFPVIGPNEVQGREGEQRARLRCYILIPQDLARLRLLPAQNPT